eukprot:sb/3473229/
MSHWRDAISKRALHVIVGEILTAGRGRRYSPGGIIRRVMEVIGAGVLFPSLGGVTHPALEISCLKPDAPLETVQRVTMEAQDAVRAIAFNRVHELLKMEPVPDVVPEPLLPAPGAGPPGGLLGAGPPHCGGPMMGRGGPPLEEGYDGAPGYPAP